MVVIMLVKLNQGFHGGAGHNELNNWTNWWTMQHDHQIPVNAIFSDNAGPLYEIQQSGFETDTLVWRRSLWHNNFNPNVPNYDAKPEDEAVRMLSYKYSNLFPQELDKTFVWLKDTNEIRTQTNPGDTWYQNLPAGEWWGRYALEAAKYAVERNYRVILLSPSSGDHTTYFWTQPAMIEFMRYAAAHKENVMIGLHEYSYVVSNLFALPGNDNGTLDDLLSVAPESRRVGRFELLYNILDEYNIDWPLIYLCEWGWSERDMPNRDAAMSQIIDIFKRLYGKYINYIKGNGTWYLGSNFGTTLPLKTNALLLPCAEFTIHNEFDIEQRLPKGEQDMCNCTAITDVRTTALWIPQYERMTDAEILQVYDWARNGFEDNLGNMTTGNHMLCPSHVDALRIHTQGLPGSVLGIAYPEKIGSGVTEQWLRDNCPCVFEDNKQVVFLPKAGPDPCTECLPMNILYSQRDPRWANVVLGQNTGHTKTIGNYGCLLTSYNIMAVYLGLTNDTPNQFNARMINAGAFTGPYIKAGALSMAFPIMKYNGYKPRGEELNDTIKAYIDVGYPVPVEVDFKPETAQWDQHWVLVIGYNNDDFYIVDPWHGDKIWLSTRYNISGNDIIQGVFYTRQTVTTQSPFGLHLRADPTDIKQAEYAEQQILLNAGGQTVKVLHNHPDSVFHTIGNMKPKNAVVRIMQSWGNRNITPTDFYNWNVDELIKKINILKGYGVDPIIEVHNEPNLVEEGWTYSWNNGFDFGMWLMDVLNKFRTRPELASLKFIYPGLSPGSTVANIRYDSRLFLNDSLSIKNMVHGFGCHAYWSTGWPMQTAIDHVNQTKQMTGKPVYLTEVSINTRPSALTPQQYGQQYAQFIKSVSVDGIYFFVGSASNGYFEPETWVSESGVSKGIATALTQNL